jgi:hypothetical protein
VPETAIPDPLGFMRPKEDHHLSTSSAEILEVCREYRGAAAMLKFHCNRAHRKTKGILDPEGTLHRDGFIGVLLSRTYQPQGTYRAGPTALTSH